MGEVGEAIRLFPLDGQRMLKDLNLRTTCFLEPGSACMLRLRAAAQIPDLADGGVLLAWLSFGLTLSRGCCSYVIRTILALFHCIMATRFACADLGLGNLREPPLARESHI
jgi:hypothetical protein